MINIKTLKIAAAAQGLNQSDLARLAGTSRQAVSLWFKSARNGFADVQSSRLMNLCKALKVTAEDLTQPLPDMGEQRRLTQTALLWDRLYPDLESFAVAACRRELQALARLVEVYGLYAAAKAAGRSVWSLFPDYQRFLPPGRRQNLERLWLLRNLPTTA